MPGRRRAVQGAGHSTVYVLWTKPGKLILVLKQPHNTALWQPSSTNYQEKKRSLSPHFRTLLPFPNVIRCSDLSIYTYRVPNSSIKILMTWIGVAVEWQCMLWESDQGVKLQRPHRPPQCEDTVKMKMSCMTIFPHQALYLGHLVLPFPSLETHRKKFLFFISYTAYSVLLQQLEHYNTSPCIRQLKQGDF